VIGVQKAIPMSVRDHERIPYGQQPESVEMGAPDEAEVETVDRGSRVGHGPPRPPTHIVELDRSERPHISLREAVSSCRGCEAVRIDVGDPILPAGVGETVRAPSTGGGGPHDPAFCGEEAKEEVEPASQSSFRIDQRADLCSGERSFLERVLDSIGENRIVSPSLRRTDA
jgi:hypothetical protein